jgi:hypothetical protein
MVTKAPRNVLRQRAWTDEQLQRAGFRHFPPVKRLTMARAMLQTEKVAVSLEVLKARTGDMMCYTPGDILYKSLDDYDHWPVKTDIFKATYKAWDEPDWTPSPTERFLMQQGCKPYYKWKGIWALRLPINIYIQSLESEGPVIVPRGYWLAVGAQGEPYHMTDADIRQRYVLLDAAV